MSTIMDEMRSLWLETMLTVVCPRTIIVLLVLIIELILQYFICVSVIESDTIISMVNRLGMRIFIEFLLVLIQSCYHLLLLLLQEFMTLSCFIQLCCVEFL